MRLRLDARHATTCFQLGVDTPFVPERIAIETGGLALVSDELGHIEANTAGPDHRHFLPNRLALQDGIQVADHFRMLDTRNRRSTRHDTGGQDDLVETTLDQIVSRYAGIQAQIDTGRLQLLLEVAQGLVELFLARHALGHVELTADLGGRIEQGHAVAALGRHRCRRQARRASTHHGDFLHLSGRDVVQFGLVAGTRIDQAAGQLATEGVIQAGLVATDAGVDLVGTTGRCLVDEFRVSQERTRHRNHVGITGRQHFLGHIGGIDAVGGAQRNADFATQFGRNLGERGTRYLGGDGRHTCLVPADTGIDDGGASLLDGLGQQDDFIPGAAALDQIEHGQTIDDDEIRAYRLAHAADDFHRQTHAVFVAAAPAISPLVGVSHEELVDEVAFRTHDLDAVVLGDLSQLGAIDEVGDLLLDALFVQLLGLERVDRRLNGARSNLLGAVGITTGMQDLHTDLAIGLMHRAGHDLVLFSFFQCGQLGRAGIDATFLVRADAAGHHQADAAAGTLGKISGHALETTRLLFQTGVHGAHQGTVLQGGETQIQRGQQIRILRDSHGHSTAVRFTVCRRLMTRRSVYAADDKEPPAGAQ